MLEQIKSHFTENIQTQIAATEAMSETILNAVDKMVMALINGNKIIACGQGGSAAEAQRFSAGLLYCNHRERPSLPAICLASNGADVNFQQHEQQHREIYSNQIRALGQAGDILLAIAPTGNERCVISAIEAALSRDMLIIALTGADGGELTGLLGENDVEMRVPSKHVQRIQEAHLLVINILCESIENSLFPIESEE